MFSTKPLHFSTNQHDVSKDTFNISNIYSTRYLVPNCELFPPARKAGLSSAVADVALDIVQPPTPPDALRVAPVL